MASSKAKKSKNIKEEVEEKVNGRELKDLEKNEIHEILDLFKNRY